MALPAYKLSSPEVQASPLLQYAFKDLGITEIPGANDNHPRIMEMYKTVGHPEVKDDSTTAWCAACWSAARISRCCSSWVPVHPR